MSSQRTAWHTAFGRFLGQHMPPEFDLEVEHTLTTEPQRADYLILRKKEVEVTNPKPARTLRFLWDRLPEHTLVEYKSVHRRFRRGDGARFLGYGHQYQVQLIEQKIDFGHLAQVLIVPSWTPRLKTEAQHLKWYFKDLEEGYYEACFAPYPLYLVVIDKVARAEQDELLGAFGHGDLTRTEHLQWWRTNVLGPQGDIDMQEQEDFEDLVALAAKHLSVDRLLALVPEEQRTRGLKPEQLLALVPEEQRTRGLKPEQRTRGLSAEESFLVLPDEALARLPDSLIASLPEAIRARIHQRLGR